MRTLVYKRTHTGDPDAAGRFGIHGCMGRVRAWEFDAVIGIGGIGPEPISHGIDGRITWIGLGPHKSRAMDSRGPLLTFDHFIIFDARGPRLEKLAPRLAKRMYDGRVRAMLHPTAVEAKEFGRVLRMAKNAPASAAADSTNVSRALPCRCGKKHNKKCPNHRAARGTC
jgi:hypothetical protein